MKVYNNPAKTEWDKILARPENDVTTLWDTTSKVLEDIKVNGDKAVMAYTEQFDKVKLRSLEVTQQEIDEACMQVSCNLKDAILVAKQNIERFHEAQRDGERMVETMPGVKCWQKSVPIEKVGLYIPGGTAPLFSTVLMLAIPAKIAGCKEIVLCTPPSKDGSIHPAILYTASLVGITKIFKAGGIQAIGALAYGTESVPKVYKIFGPGNRFVTAAKQLVNLKEKAIDMPAGPSELLVMADESANAAFVASDLLSQAEHGADSQVVLVTDSEKLVRDVQVEVEKQLSVLPRKEVAEQALSHSLCIVMPTLDDMIELSNHYAPEHLILSVRDDEEVAGKVIHAGSVFMGHYTPESAGDYASGTNHTLPTHGYTRSYSGVNLDAFVKKITYQKIQPEGLKKIGPSIELMAATEQLEAHKNAVTIRLQQLNKQ